MVLSLMIRLVEQQLQSANRVEVRLTTKTEMSLLYIVLKLVAEKLGPMTSVVPFMTQMRLPHLIWKTPVRGGLMLKKTKLKSYSIQMTELVWRQLLLSCTSTTTTMTCTT